MDCRDCQKVWLELVDGTSRILDTFTTNTHAYLVITPSSTFRLPLGQRRQKIIEQVVLGSSVKATAFDFGLAHSTTAIEVKLALEAMGSHGAKTKIPLALAMLVHAAHSQLPVAFERFSCFDAEDKLCNVLSAPIASVELSPAVREVVFLHAAGNSHAQIATRRRTSRRTVANQLATAFHRLGVSGRSGVLGYLALAPRSG